jgi:hypothetical protein
MTTVFLGVLFPPNVQENWRLETGLRGFAVQQTYVFSVYLWHVFSLVPIKAQLAHDKSFTTLQKPSPCHPHLARPTA